MRVALIALGSIVFACSSSPAPGGDAGTDVASSDVASSDVASGDGSDACTQTMTGDESATRACTFSLCHPTGETYELLDVSSVDHIIRPGATGAFAVGSYAAADLDVMSSFEVYTSTTTYAARGGPSPYPGQNVLVKLDSVVSPSQLPCDGKAHGTVDATLVELAADGGVGSGHVTVHVTF